MYKKSVHHILILLAAGLIVCLSVTQGLALPEVSLGNTELNVYGFLRNNYGYFLENQDYTIRRRQAGHKQDLAADQIPTGDCRTPSVCLLLCSLYMNPNMKSRKGPSSKPDGREYSEYDNLNDVLREAYIDWRPSSNNSFRIGRQIVIWGESLTTKVGDVVNPDR